MRAGRLSIVNKSDPMAPTHYILSAAVLPQSAAAISSRRLQSPPRRARPRMAVRGGALAYRRKIQNMLKSLLKEYFHFCKSLLRRPHLRRSQKFDKILQFFLNFLKYLSKIGEIVQFLWTY